MSAGNFLDAFYETDTGDIAPIRIQPETASLVIASKTNTIPAGPAVIPVAARISGSRRAYGIHARRVRVKFGDSPPTGYQQNGTVTLPWLQVDTFASLKKGDTGTYLGSSVTYVGKSPEQIR